MLQCEIFKNSWHNLCKMRRVKKKIVIYPLLVMSFFLLAFRCSSITKVTDAITKPTARELYKREFKNQETAFSLWDAAYQTALKDSVAVPLPYGEKGTFEPSTNVTYSYNVKLEAGEMLTATVEKDSVSQRTFMEILEFRNGSFESVESGSENSSYLEFPVKNPGLFKVIIQPEIAANTSFFIQLNKKPLYGFPVAGKGNAAIQSFWSDSRDGGKRSDEGIDIFASRGTPVVAVTDGTISYTGDRGLGGKQVWQRAGLFGNSIYYAHLDWIAVSDGQSVKMGDTLGFVGNTGNAKTTTPHLHFGIYRTGGAVNPLPFVYQTKDLKSAAFANKEKSTIGKLKGKANLRIGPDTNYGVVFQLQPNDTISILGRHHDWLHIETNLGKGFLHKSLVKNL